MTTVSVQLPFSVKLVGKTEQVSVSQFLVKANLMFNALEQIR